MVPVVYETDTPAAPRTDLGPYREADYVALPEEPRCELLYGRFVLMTSPSVRHQRVVLRLAKHLLDIADRTGSEAIIAPMDVRLADHSVVQPDIVFVSRARRGVIQSRIHGAPDLLVEVLSPTTARRDLGEKLRLYGETGVAEYWLVDPGLGTFEFLEHREGAWRLRLPEGAIHRSSVVPGVELDLEAFWRSIPE
jgi:Uma2 family endonuclease